VGVRCYCVRRCVVFQFSRRLFRRVWKIAKSDCWLRHVCAYVGMEQPVSRWAGFHEIWYLNIFRKSNEKIQVALKSDKNDGYVTWRPIYSTIMISRWILLRVRMFQTKLYRKSKHAYYVRQRFFFPPRLIIYNNLALPTLLYGRETWAIREHYKSRKTSAEVKYTLQD